MNLALNTKHLPMANLSGVTSQKFVGRVNGGKKAVYLANYIVRWTLNK